jgi:low temperature requirement protein LtrA
VTNEIDKLGPKDFTTGCLVIVVAIFVVPFLVLIFKISVYLAIFIGVIVAVLLGIALLGRLIRLIFFGSRSDDQNQS